MKHIAGIAALTLVNIITAMSFLIACAPDAEVASVSTPEPTPMSTATPTTTPTATPSPTPTATPVAKSVPDQQKQDFINKTGEYTFENIKNELFYLGIRDDIYNLGVVGFFNSPSRENETQVVVQGWLFGYREENGNLNLEVGFDSKDGKKGIIKDVIVPISFFQQHEGSGIGLGFEDYEYWQKLDSSRTFLGLRNNVESITDYLDDFLDKPMMFTFYTKLFIDSTMNKLFGETTTTALVNLINENSSAVNQLLSEISDNGEDIKIGNIDKIGSSLLILSGVGACFE